MLQACMHVSTSMGRMDDIQRDVMCCLRCMYVCLLGAACGMQPPGEFQLAWATVLQPCAGRRGARRQCGSVGGAGRGSPGRGATSRQCPLAIVHSLTLAHSLSGPVGPSLTHSLRRPVGPAASPAREILCQYYSHCTCTCSTTASLVKVTAPTHPPTPVNHHGSPIQVDDDVVDVSLDVEGYYRRALDSTAPPR